MARWLLDITVQVQANSADEAWLKVNAVAPKMSTPENKLSVEYISEAEQV